MDKVREICTLQVRVRGTVQGVGFRPTVWKLAQYHQLTGTVRNDTEGVLIEVQGASNALNLFVAELQTSPPPLSRIESLDVTPLTDTATFSDFRILTSASGQNDTRISADAAVCRECRTECLAPTERRYLYPFTNCTHCGPRLTIVNRVPYDRSTTTMASFPMCEDCRAEYENPADRRFHAQPIACHTCGPRIWLEENSQVIVEAQNTQKILNAAVSVLREGKILAIRGLGGFHLAVDAENEKAVLRLRERKHRYAKPLALMVSDVDQVEKFCHVSEVERDSLMSPEAPIVLLEKRLDNVSGRLAEAIAPDSMLLGFMLAYSPLHLLLCQFFGRPLVMTSGNLSGQPQIVDLNEAREKLTGIADAMLMHNRDIANRVDDSVVRQIGGKMCVMRRARGFAPQPIPLPPGLEKATDILAFGGELKSTFCLIKDGHATLSQHQGDLEDPDTFDDFEHNLSLYLSQYQQQPTLLACDRHPEYLSTKLCLSESEKQQLQQVSVQHHHAHIASCLADNACPVNMPNVMGIALDGLGFGGDDTLWGAEWLLTNYRTYTRLASFDAVPMPGGAMAIKEPWRNLFAALHQNLGWEETLREFGHLDVIKHLGNKPVQSLLMMLQKNLNAPKASSCGRLFDAVAASLGLAIDKAHFEGQGAVALEMLVSRSKLNQDFLRSHGYPFEIREDGHLLRLSTRPMWRALLSDLSNHCPSSHIAYRFHLGLAQAITQMTVRLSLAHGFEQVAISGGCAQNRVLVELMQQLLETEGFRVLTQSKVPANDGGLSLGQAVVAACQADQLQ